MAGAVGDQIKDTAPGTGTGRPAAKKTTPPASRNKGTGSPKKKGPGRPPNSMADELEGFIASIAMPVLLIDRRDGAAIIAGAPKLAKALDDLARDNKQLRETLQKMLQVTGWGQLAAAVAAIVVPIVANHTDIVPAMVVPMVAPDLATVEAELDEAENNALAEALAQMQQEAEGGPPSS